MVTGPAIADIAMVNRDGTGLRILTDGSANFGFPGWSPDGSQIVYRASDKDNSGLFVMMLATGAVRALTPGSSRDNFPAWSPDGEWLAFASARGGFKDESVLHPYSGQPNADIYVMRADGSDIRQLTDTPFEEGTVAWAPLRR